MFDIAIIGTGPAGISAALTAKVRNKSFVLLGEKDLSLKMRKDEIEGLIDRIEKALAERNR